MNRTTEDMIALGGARSNDLDVGIAADYVPMHQTLCDYLLIGLIVLVMCTTIAGMGIRIYQALGG